jgi:hypothetical protein
VKRNGNGPKVEDPSGLKNQSGGDSLAVRNKISTAAMSHKIADDAEIAKLVKEAGFKLGLINAQDFYVYSNV